MAKSSHSVNNLLINIKASIYFCWNEFTNLSATAGGIFKSNNDDSLYFFAIFHKEPVNCTDT